MSQPQTQTKHPQNIHLDPALHKRLVAFKAKSGMSYNEFFRRAATEALNSFDKTGEIPKGA